MTAYARHDDPDYASKTAAGCEADGEPVFLLRAQDRWAPLALYHWASFVENNLSNNGLANEARRIAGEMAKWPTRKEPD
jgi:hypothetical protein